MDSKELYLVSMNILLLPAYMPDKFYNHTAIKVIPSCPFEEEQTLCPDGSCVVKGTTCGKGEGIATLSLSLE